MWLVFVSYAFIWAPVDRGNTMSLIMDAIFFRTDRLDVSVIAVFNLLGVWPGIYASILLADAAGRRLPAWPFVLGSCVLGAFALLPYLALREDDGTFRGTRTGAVRFFDSRAVGAGLFASTLLLIGLGLLRGDLARYGAMFKTESLVHMMTIDFAVLSCVFPSALAADMERRGLRSRSLFWLVASLPLVGPAAYVALRPKLRAPAH